MLLKIHLILIVFMAVTFGSVQHNNLIIAVGDELEFLTDGNAYRTLTLNSYNATKLSSLAYDATTRKLFFSDQRHHYGHIFSVSLDNESHRPVEDIVEKNNNETVESLAYDPVNKMLLWTDGLNRAIRRVQIDNDPIHIEEKDGIEIVHFLENDAKPRGLVSDPCTRMLYWTNVHDSNPTIERSFLNGSHREIVLHSDLLLPNAFDLDIMEQMLYWAEDLHNGYFRIERSYVNGTGRQEFYRGMGSFIVSLTVGDDFVYWSDYNHKKIWCLRKDGSSRSPLSLGTFRNPALGLVVIHHQPVNCTMLSEDGQAEKSFAEKSEIITIAVCLTGTCLILMGIVAALIFRVWKSMGCQRLAFVSNKNEDDTFPFHYFDDYSNSYAMVEKATP
ncbi:protein cueball-like isoform X2 [Daphnia pulicaria]|uniref:protein cueball-like isoform X2 n=1 Tax=Daphnia pulicaria TaxID=35523 RepID=UPI001EEA299E|nr:protein cueball-like isoform X2 [Daphnia pulicaria]